MTEHPAVIPENEQSVDARPDTAQNYARLKELDCPALVLLIRKAEISGRYTVDCYEERNTCVYYNFVGNIEE